MPTPSGTIGDDAAAPRAPRWLASGWFLALLTVLAGLIRTPRALIEGRLWAEEGSTFAQELIGRDLVGAATYVYKGTTVVLTALPVWLALHAPAEQIPRITTWLALAVEIVLAAQMARWARDANVSPVATALAFAGFLLMPGQYEVAATATNTQWICSLSCLLMLLMSPAALAGRRAPLAVLWTLLCGATGVPSSMLAPAFLVRGAIERSRIHFVLGGVLCATTALQLSLIVTHSVGEGRQLSTSPYVIALAASAQTIWAPVVGARAAGGLGAFALGGDPPGYGVGIGMIAAAASAVAVLAAMARAGGASRRLLAVLLCTWAGVTVLNVFGALGDDQGLLRGSWRYFVFGSLCLVLLIGLASRGGGAVRHMLCLALLGWMTLVAAAPRLLGHRFAEYDDGPSWQTQIIACERRRARLCDVVIWPRVADPRTQRRWMVSLPARYLTTTDGAARGGPSPIGVAEHRLELAAGERANR